MAQADQADTAYKLVIQKIGTSLGEMTTDPSVQTAAKALNQAWQGVVGAIKAVEAKAPQPGAEVAAGRLPSAMKDYAATEDVIASRIGKLAADLGADVGYVPGRGPVEGGELGQVGYYAALLSSAMGTQGWKPNPSDAVRAAQQLGESLDLLSGNTPKLDRIRRRVAELQDKVNSWAKGQRLELSAISKSVDRELAESTAHLLDVLQDRIEKAQDKGDAYRANYYRAKFDAMHDLLPVPRSNLGTAAERQADLDAYGITDRRAPSARERSAFKSTLRRRMGVNKRDWTSYHDAPHFDQSWAELADALEATNDPEAEKYARSIVHSNGTSSQMDYRISALDWAMEKALSRKGQEWEKVAAIAQQLSTAIGRKNMPRVQLSAPCRAKSIAGRRVQKQNEDDPDELKDRVKDALDRKIEDMANAHAAEACSTPDDTLVEEIGGGDPSNVWIIAEFGGWFAVNGDVPPEGEATPGAPRGFEITDRGGDIPTTEEEVSVEHAIRAVVKELTLPEEQVAAIAKELGYKDLAYISVSGDTEVYARNTGEAREESASRWRLRRKGIAKDVWPPKLIPGKVYMVAGTIDNKEIAGKKGVLIRTFERGGHWTYSGEPEPWGEIEIGGERWDVRAYFLLDPSKMVKSVRKDGNSAALASQLVREAMTHVQDSYKQVQASDRDGSVKEKADAASKALRMYGMAVGTLKSSRFLKGYVRKDVSGPQDLQIGDTVANNTGSRYFMESHPTGVILDIDHGLLGAYKVRFDPRPDMPDLKPVVGQWEGRRLRKVTAKASSATTPQPQEEKPAFCSKCGTKLGSDGKCAKCGTEPTASKSEAQSENALLQELKQSLENALSVVADGSRVTDDPSEEVKGRWIRISNLLDKAKDAVDLAVSQVQEDKADGTITKAEEPTPEPVQGEKLEPSISSTEALADLSKMAADPIAAAEASSAFLAKSEGWEGKLDALAPREGEDGEVFDVLRQFVKEDVAKAIAIPRFMSTRDNPSGEKRQGRIDNDLGTEKDNDNTCSECGASIPPDRKLCDSCEERKGAIPRFMTTRDNPSGQ